MHPFFARSLGQIASSTQASVTVYPLNSLGVFEATGPDTLSFLQGQLTNDIIAPGIGQSRLAGYCTAQGRLLSTMVLGQAPTAPETQTVRGMMRLDILPAVLKRLSMFVLRAKVSLRAETLGVAGVCAATSHRAELAVALGHDLPETEWETLHASTGTWISAPNVKPLDSSLGEPLSRWWWIAGPEHLAACEMLSFGWSSGQGADWESMDIQAGLPWIEAHTQDLFIPQTLNLELIGGVSFTKGCYPGQEIVARSHYRGTVKKRMALGKLVPSVMPTPLPGSDIFDASQPGQPCGRLINVAVTESETETIQWVLFETSFEAYDRQQLRAVDDHGPIIETMHLPYSTR